MPKKIIEIEESSDDNNTDNESTKSESEPEKLTKPIKKLLLLINLKKYYQINKKLF